MPRLQCDLQRGGRGGVLRDSSLQGLFQSRPIELVPLAHLELLLQFPKALFQPILLTPHPLPQGLQRFPASLQHLQRGEAVQIVEAVVKNAQLRLHYVPKLDHMLRQALLPVQNLLQLRIHPQLLLPDLGGVQREVLPRLRHLDLIGLLRVDALVQFFGLVDELLLALGMQPAHLVLAGPGPRDLLPQLVERSGLFLEARPLHQLQLLHLLQLAYRALQSLGNAPRLSLQQFQLPEAGTAVGLDLPVPVEHPHQMRQNGLKARRVANTASGLVRMHEVCHPEVELSLREDPPRHQEVRDSGKRLPVPVEVLANAMAFYGEHTAYGAGLEPLDDLHDDLEQIFAVAAVLDEAALVGEVEADVGEEGENALERLNSLHF